MTVTVWELLGYGGWLIVVFAALVSVYVLKGIPIGPLAQWGKDLTYYLTPFFCLVNWDMNYPGIACRGTDLPPGRILYIHMHTVYKHYSTTPLYEPQQAGALQWAEHIGYLTGRASSRNLWTHNLYFCYGSETPRLGNQTELTALEGTFGINRVYHICCVQSSPSPVQNYCFCVNTADVL